MRPAALALSLALLAVPSIAAANDILVLPDGSGEAPTIAAAIVMAVAGDTITLGDGTFLEHNLNLKDGVRFRSVSGNPSLTRIDAESAGRCFSGSTMGAPFFRGITLQNGTDPAEGGLLLLGSSNVTFSNCVFKDGTAPRGGAVSLIGGSSAIPRFIGCRFESNQAGSDGGAVWTRGTGSFGSCEFIDNSAVSGGAAYCQKVAGFAKFDGCRFEQNTATGDGGAVFSSGTTPLFSGGTNMVGCEFLSNAAANGGAVRIEQFDFVRESDFLRNEAAVWGGAVLTVTLQLDDCAEFFQENLLAGNVAGSRGGGIAVTGDCVSGCYLFVYRCTLSGNQAPIGAHVWSQTGFPWGAFQNSIFAFGITGAAVGASPISSVRCCDVYGNAGGDYVGGLAAWGSTNANISAGPLFCDAQGDDFTLGQGSPCLPPLPSACGGLPIGKYGAGCSPTATEETSWGRIKSTFY
jgi:predicted outer membrane repeat protein